MMPRRPPIVYPDIPLFSIPSIIRDAIKSVGEEVERIVVRKSNRHMYIISVHTRSVKREPGPTCPGAAP